MDSHDFRNGNAQRILLCPRYRGKEMIHTVPGYQAYVECKRKLGKAELSLPEQVSLPFPCSPPLTLVKTVKRSYRFRSLPANPGKELKRGLISPSLLSSSRIPVKRLGRLAISVPPPPPPLSPIKELEEYVIPSTWPPQTSIALEDTKNSEILSSTPPDQKKEKQKPQVFLECYFSREDKAHKDAVLIPLSKEFITCGKVFTDIIQLFGEPEDNLVLPCPWSVEEIQFTEQVLQFITEMSRLCHLDSIYERSYYDWFRLIHCFRGRFRIKPFTCPSVMAMLIKNRKVFEFYILDCNMAFVDVLYSLQYLEKSIHPCLRLDFPSDFLDVKWICQGYRSVQPPKPDPGQKKIVEVRPSLNPNYDREV